MKKLLYLSAGSSKWGTGHLLRSIELIDILRKKGLHIYTIALVPDVIEMQKLSVFINGYDRRVQSLHEIDVVNADGIVVDVHTSFQTELFLWLKEQRHMVVALDWYHDIGNIIVARANLRGGAEALKYAIIRREFQDALRNRSELNPEYDAVAVIGGGDNRRHLDKIFSIFTEDGHFLDKKIALILGPMVDGKLSKFAGNSVRAVTVLRNPDNIAWIMSNTSVGITNGGTSLMEFTMLGVPTIVFPQSEEEENFVKPFIENRCSVLGLLETEGFTTQIIELWKDEKLRKTLSENGRKLIDGHGAERIAEIIFNTFSIH